MRAGGVILAGLLFVALPLSAGARADKGKAFKTPKEVFEAAQGASKAGDARAFLECLAPDVQKKMAAGFALQGVTLRARDDARVKEKFKPAFDVLDKQGLTAEATKKVPMPKDPAEAEKVLNDLGSRIKDPVSFAAAYLKALKEAGVMPGFHPMPPGELKDVKVTGDKAQGTFVIKVEGKEREEPIGFGKVDGGWRLLAPERKPEGPGPAPKKGPAEK